LARARDRHEVLDLAVGRLALHVAEENAEARQGEAARERQPHQTLQPTALVHEAYLRLSSQPGQWERRGHFFAAAALAMRRILVERARHYQRMKHGGGGKHLESNEELPGADPELTDVIAIHEALTQLEATDPRKAQVVTLRYFAGLSVEETAGALNVSPATVKNEWMFARAWLFRVHDSQLMRLPERSSRLPHARCHRTPSNGTSLRRIWLRIFARVLMAAR
jgi:RNA polymerase sigma factor (TIGR02999 family)